MVITSISRQVKNPERVSVFVDGKYSFSLSLNEVIEQKIKNGMELTQADVKRLKKVSDDGKLKARALEWLLNRPHSTREFKDYLFRKKAGPELTEQFIKYFSAKNYLDDETYARWLTEMRQRAGKSNRAIAAELFKKGVARETVELVLEDESISEEDRLKELVGKKQKLLRYKNDPQKLAQYLMRQGFNYQLIKEALAIKQPED